MKVSYLKHYDKNGTCYNQAVSMDAEEYKVLNDALISEQALGNPRQKEYVNGNTANLPSFNKNIEYGNFGYLLFPSLSQIRFFNIFLKLKLKDRNTCILINKLR